jgi:hypothetical protein
VTTPAFPPGRYGRRRAVRRTPRWLIPLLASAVVGAGLFVAWSMYRTYTADSIQSRVTRFDSVTDSSIRVTFEVIKDGGEPATCVVRARSRDGREVGRAEVPVPAGERGGHAVTVTYTLATSQRPVTGEVQRCAPGNPE